jgi:hypothetical protein
MSTVYRILNADRVACNTSGRPDEAAVFTNGGAANRAVRRLNNPDYLPSGAPQPQGRPFERQTGEIIWEAP